MKWTLYADESGISAHDRCYTIGALLVPETRIDAFDNLVRELRASHGVVGEAKWTKVGNSHGLINFGLDMAQRVIEGPFSFQAMVVNKSLYRNWQGPQETAFYKTYTLLIENATRMLDTEVSVKIDNAIDSYPKQHEVVHKIANYKLRSSLGLELVTELEKVDSKEVVAVQVADMLTGAINAGHNQYLKPDMQLNLGKQVFLERLANILGWNRIIYDTWPNAHFNIWHFPIEYRRTPATRQIAPNCSVPFVSPHELRNTLGAT